MKYPLVSVIIPYYKKINFFHKSLLSVLNQEYKNIELIVIYDDRDLNDLKKIRSLTKYNKIKLIVNRKNLGAGLSRNIGIKKSRGKYIAFLDSDDLWLKNKLKTQIQLMEKYNYKFTHTDYYIIDKNDHIIKKRHIKKNLKYKELLLSCDIGLSSVIVKKNALRGLKFANIKTKEDYVLWLNLSKKIDLIGINKPLMKWRKLDNSLSSSNIQKLKDGFLVYKKYMKFNYFKSLIYLIILSLNYLKKM